VVRNHHDFEAVGENEIGNFWTCGGLRNSKPRSGSEGECGKGQDQFVRHEFLTGLAGAPQRPIL
jgi:hypothetical protein